VELGEVSAPVEPAAAPRAPEPPVRTRRAVDLSEARAALDGGRFWTEYQAIVHARTGKTCAFEALATADAARAQAMIAALRGRRVAVALDDVGAANGLLSFDAIADAEVLKFDRTLIPRLRHPRARALVEALVRMGRETGAHTVLEGVETTAEFVLARDLGFDLVQGFLFRDRARVAKR
jgi:EAL domain-containing protein (putative c-di-GMP-specific phosphodiesterase class I)